MIDSNLKVWYPYLRVFICKTSVMFNVQRFFRIRSKQLRSQRLHYSNTLLGLKI